MLADLLFGKRPKSRVERVRDRGVEVGRDLGHALVRVEREAVETVRARPFETAGILLLGLGLACLVIGAQRR